MKRIRRLAQVGCVLVFAAAATAQAAVDLEWRVENEFIQVGDTVRVGLYAVADNGEEDELFCAMQVVVDWDPGILGFLGVCDDGPYDWMSSGFPDDSGLDGLNNTFDDGDAYYHAWANFGDPPGATAQGLLVTTFEFEALATTDGTDLFVLETLGYHSVTAVLDAAIPGLNIVDELDIENIVIGEGGLPGDVDGDGDVDLNDLSVLLAAYGSCEGDPGYEPAADLDQDGCVGLLDLSVLLAHYGL